MLVDHDALDAALGALTRGSGRDPFIGESLPELIGTLSRLLGTSGAGLMLLDDRNDLRYVAATDEAARTLEAAQQKHGHGPCISAFHEDRLTTVDDTQSDPRWPDLAEPLRSAGVGAVMGVPTHLGGGTVGTLNVYHVQPTAWDESQHSAIRALNQVLEHQLTHAVASRQQHAVVAQLQYALDNRVVIERAIGLLMARHQTDAATAFDHLRRDARSQRRPVGDVATELVRRHESDRK